AAFRIVDDPRLHMVQSDPLDPVCGPFQITRLLAVELEEGAAVLLDLLRRLHLAEQIRRPDLDAAVAGDVKVPAPFGGDDAEVLDRRFGAVSGAAGDGHLDL